MIIYLPYSHNIWVFSSKTPGCYYRKHPGVVVSLSLSYSHIEAIVYIYKSILLRIGTLYKLDIPYKNRQNTSFFRISFTSNVLLYITMA